MKRLKNITKILLRPNAKPNHQHSELSRQTMKVRKNPTTTLFPYPDEKGQEQRWKAPNKETIKSFGTDS